MRNWHTVMSIMRLPLPAGIQARMLLHLLLEHGDVAGHDAAGRTVIQLAVNDHTLETAPDLRGR
jgi:hypothetical protein